ncbi:Zinc transporter 11 [Forsythia ovata]|uniref:Zinc transporter 11 n=1 Tax=Forsythia ovata TaxID=205694 RepID=A0ABD1S5K0_9LAMI
MARYILILFFTLLLLVVSASAHGGSHDGDSDSDPDSGSQSDKPNLRSRSLILVKIWCLILVFVGTFVGGISPYFMKWNEGFLVTGTQFAGGVFLGTALMHFLSDSNETFGNLTEKEKQSDHEFQGSHDEKGASNGIPSQSQLQIETGTEEHLARHSITSATSLGDSILLIVALCFHSVFEGIAIGVAETRADAWRALWTLMHFAFAISSPVGVAIGIIIDATTQGAVADWLYAISMGLACGVFIYVSINHLLSKGYKPRKSVSVDKPHYKFLAVLLGVGVIAVVMIWD